MSEKPILNLNLSSLLFIIRYLYLLHYHNCRTFSQRYCTETRCIQLFLLYWVMWREWVLKTSEKWEYEGVKVIQWVQTVLVGDREAGFPWLQVPNEPNQTVRVQICRPFLDYSWSVLGSSLKLFFNFVLKCVIDVTGYINCSNTIYKCVCGFEMIQEMIWGARKCEYVGTLRRWRLMYVLHICIICFICPYCSLW